MPSAETVFCLFNLVEGILWIGIGLAFLVAAGRGSHHRRLKLATCLLFLAFGLSDLVEIHTGGWYKPWWLLLWKGLTLCGLVAVFVVFQRRRASGDEQGR